MKFEEEFPSLEGKETNSDGEEFVHYIDFADSQKEMIQEYCLDKQRVRDAIEKHFKESRKGKLPYLPKRARELQQELGL